MNLTTDSGNALEGHIAHGAVCAYERLLIVDGENAVFDLSSDKAVSLPVPNSTMSARPDICFVNVHSLGTERSGHQEDFPVANSALDLLSSLWAPIDDFHLDTSIFQGSQCFAFRPVVVHAWLTVFRTVNCVPLTEFDLAHSVQFLDLPANETIVEWIRICRNERATPINT